MLFKYCFIALVVFFSKGAFAQKTFKPVKAYTDKAAAAYEMYEKQHYLQSALAYDSLFKISKGQGLVQDKYNAACSWALSKQPEKAIVYLQQAVNEGKWANLNHTLTDSNLDILHTDARWQTLIDTIKANKAELDAKLNKPLVALLDTVLIEDQDDRRKIDTIRKQYGWQSNEIDSLWKKIGFQDSVNLKRVKNIIDKFGWLGPEEIGNNGAMTLFLVIQHADSTTQVQYLPKMREAVKRGKALPQNLALLEDRVLINQGKPQIYGSQVNQNSGLGTYNFYPIQDEPNVNKRRAAVGLNSLEEYAKSFKFEYVLPLKPKAFTAPKRKTLK